MEGKGERKFKVLNGGRQEKEDNLTDYDVLSINNMENKPLENYEKLKNLKGIPIILYLGERGKEDAIPEKLIEIDPASLEINRIKGERYSGLKIDGGRYRIYHEQGEWKEGNITITVSESKEGTKLKGEARIIKN